MDVDDKARVCWCLSQAQPKDCPHCFKTVYGHIVRQLPCPDHILAECSMCAMQFHKGCLKSILRKQDDNSVGHYLCLRCQTVSHYDVYLPWSLLLSLKDKNMLFGLPSGSGPPEGETGQVKMRTRRRTVTKALQRCNGRTVCAPLSSRHENSSPHLFTNQDPVPDLLQRSAPRPVPTWINMHPDMTHNIVMSGCRFEASLLLFPILKCACCGWTSPYHDDPEFPDNPPLQRSHLNIKPKDAHHCTGECCRGSQLWSLSRPKIMKAYLEQHTASVNPPDNAVICQLCSDKVPAKYVGGACDVTRHFCILTVLTFSHKQDHSVTARFPPGRTQIWIKDWRIPPGTGWAPCQHIDSVLNMGFQHRTRSTCQKQNNCVTSLMISRRWRKL